MTGSVDGQLRSASVVFWDFDGVIKDSVAVKGDAFERLFAPYGNELGERIRQHHGQHGGVSRYEKIPLYLRWAGEADTPERVDDLCGQFARLARQAVIESPWVPGVREYLEEQYQRQHFVLITATPQAEIKEIVRVLQIAHCFRDIHGAPMSKSVAIAAELARLNCRAEAAVVVGDSRTDVEAAEANGVPFLLRRTPLNHALHSQFAGASFDVLVPTVR